MSSLPLVFVRSLAVAFCTNWSLEITVALKHENTELHVGETEGGSIT